MSGSAIRQEYLQTALKWIAASQTTPQLSMTIEGYMSKHQHDPNASQLWQYFSAVATWATDTFPYERPKIMKGVNWGKLYDDFHDKILDKEALEKEISRLIIDDEVQNKKGIYPYVLTRDEHCLNLRTFPDGMKLAAYERQNGICALCGKHFELDEMEADHITPWRDGGLTIAENCQMLCRECNRRKGAK